MRWRFVFLVLLIAGCKFTVTTVGEEEKARKPVPPRPTGYDTAYLVKGDEVRGRLLEMSGEEVLFLDVHGKRWRWKRSEVQRVEFQKLRKGYTAKTVAELKDRLLEDVLKRKVKKDDYPDARYVVLHESIKITRKGKEVEVVRRFIAQVTQDAGRYRVGNRALLYLSDRTEAEILWARTVLPDGSLKHIDDSAIEDGAVYSNLPDYNLLRKRKFALSEVGVDAVVDVCTKEVHAQSLAQPFYVQFLFGNVEPILYKEVVVEYREDSPLRAVLLRKGDVTVTVEKVEEKGKVNERFWVADVEAIEEETDMPPLSELVPSVVVCVSEGGWDTLGSRYASAIEDVFREDSVREKALELTAGLKDVEEKAKALYRFIVCKKDYVDVGLDEWRLIPHPAAWSLRQGRLNALDKAVLFVCMAKAVGVDSELLLVRGRSEGAFARSAVSLGAFSTTLVLCRINDEDVYLSLTTPETPFGYIPPPMQGGVALLVDEEKPRLLKLPLLRSSEEVLERVVDASIEVDGTYRAKVKLTVRGNKEAVWRKKATLKPEELQRDMLEMVKGLDTRAVLDGMNLRNLGEPTQPLEIEFEYHIPGWALKAGEKLLVFRLPEINYTAWELEKEKRANPLWWESRTLIENHYKIKIPNGYRARYIVGKVFGAGDDDSIRYEASFDEEKGKVLFFDRTERRALLLEPSRYGVYVDILTTRAKVAQEWIIIEAE